MKIPVAWLREYVEVPEDEAGLSAFNDMLTMAGLEVEEVLSTPAGPTLYTKITPNRGDWASVYGTAREAAAAGKLALKPLPGYPERAPDETAPAGDGAHARVAIEDAENCPRFSATVIRGVKIGPSPQWMQDRLTAAGMRPVNNVVDVTNYVMLEVGQPLHAYDLDALKRGAPDGRGHIVVRQARDGERLTTLDGVERELAPGMLLICDHAQPIGVAGIMGGGPTEVTDGTTDLLLEAAHFDAFSVRRTTKRLGLSTEASYRFERHVDPLLVGAAAERAAKLIVETAGGAVTETVDVVARRIPPRRVTARVERIRKLLGADVDRDEMVAGLERLGLSVERSAGALDVLVPSFRPDLTIEDDIAEEVGRIALGYENLPETLPPLRSGRGRDSDRGRFVSVVRAALAAAGMQDIHSHSLVAPSPLATEEEAAHRVTIRSALSPELSSLRTSLLPNLFAIVARAHAAGTRDIAVFEVGPVYRKEGEGEYREPLRVAGVLSGSAMPQAWSVKPDALPADFFYAKGIVEDLLRAVAGATDAAFERGEHPLTHPGRTATVSVGGQTVGVVAEVSEAVAEAQGLPRRTYVFDLDGDALLALFTAGGSAVRYAPLPKYPSIVRDLAPVFASSTPYAEVERIAAGAAGPLLESLRLTDVYEGANLGEGKRSLTLRFTFRSKTATLKDAEVEAALSEVRRALVEQAGAELRA
jgi:phenylalanyl-tRNA synthetase beta chain